MVGATCEGIYDQFNGVGRWEFLGVADKFKIVATKVTKALDFNLSRCKDAL